MRCQPRGRTRRTATSSFSAYCFSARVERDRPLDRVRQVLLAVDDVRPRGRVRVLEVGHVDPRARVERVDHHLPVAGRPGDLDAAVLEVRRNRLDTPVALADRRGSTRGSRAARRRSIRSCRSARASRSCSRRSANSRWSATTRSSASGVSTPPRPAPGRHGGGAGAHPVRAASNCASSVEPLSASVELCRR